MKIALLIMCILMCLITTAQEGNFTQYKYYNDTDEVYLRLREDKTYTFAHNSHYGDYNPAGFALSRGYYKIHGKILILIDTYRHFTMKFKKTKNGFIGLETFGFIKNRLFTIDSFPDEKMTDPCIRDRPFFTCTHPLSTSMDNMPLSPGIYMRQMDSMFYKDEYYNYTLRFIFTNSHYAFYYGKTCFSAGTWQQKREKIYLYDRSLLKTFELAFIDNKIYLVNFLDVYECCTYVKVE